MANKTFIIILFSLLTAGFLQGQNVQFSNIPVDKLQSLNYVGTTSRHHCFSSQGYKMHLFDRRNTSSISTYEYKFDDKKEFEWSKYLVGEKLFVISKFSQAEKEKYTCLVNVYEFNATTGEKVKKVQTGGVHDKHIYYTTEFDTSHKQIVIMIDDSIVNLLDYELQPVAFEKGAEYEAKGSFFGMEDVAIDLEQLMEALNLKFNFTITTSEKKHVDSVSSDNFRLSYDRKEDKGVPFYNKFYSQVVITTMNKGSKVQDVDFGIDNEKVIIDLVCKENKAGELIVFGKYIIKGSRHAQYGMFSAKYDQMLNQVAPLKYYELLSTEVDEKVVPNVRHVGLFYTKLAYPRHKYVLDDGTMLFVYQKEYTNVKDHIYILKVDPSGDLIINMIPTHVIVDKKNPYSTEKFIPVLLKDKLVFIFYENPANLDKSMNDIDVAWCKADDKSSVLVYCYYDIATDDVRKKQLISENKAMKPLPHLSEYSLYYDTETGECLCFVPGENKKNVSKFLYQFSLSY